MDCLISNGGQAGHPSALGGDPPADLNPFRVRARESGRLSNLVVDESLPYGDQSGLRSSSECPSSPFRSRRRVSCNNYRSLLTCESGRLAAAGCGHFAGHFTRPLRYSPRWGRHITSGVRNTFSPWTTIFVRCPRVSAGQFPSRRTHSLHLVSVRT